MATIDTDILEAALADGLIPKRLTVRQKRYLHRSVLSANSIYWAIANEDGLEVEQLVSRLNLAANTIKIYCRWMISNNLLETEEERETGKICYFTKKHHSLIKIRHK